MEKTGPKSYGGYACAEESLLPGGTSPFIISNDDDDDDLVSVSELFTRADPDPAATVATATPAAGTHKRQILEAVPRGGAPKRGLRLPPRCRNNKLRRVPRRPRGQIQALA